ncbi:ubiquinol-cytochrome c reductase iron-sulfur subunit [Thermodesulfobacteriota bacterium]
MRLKESLLSRRWFLTGLIWGGLAAFAAYIADPVVRYVFHKKKQPLPKAVTIAQADVDGMAPNSAAYFQYGYMPAVLLKTAEGELRAFSARCTHLDCNVQYVPESRQFYCACHEGFFDDLGVNVAGPPPTPLPAFDMQAEGERIVLSFDEKKSKHA